MNAPLGLPMVYLVDDEQVLRDALAWLLRSRRLLSEGFASAESFVALLDAPRTGAWPTAPSCLLLDVRMPGMSGLALFDQLVERNRGVRGVGWILAIAHGAGPREQRGS